MYIDDFIWLPDILEKLAVKHHVTRTRWRKCFSALIFVSATQAQSTGLLNN
jgi:hypothetical protein